MVKKLFVINPNKEKNWTAVAVSDSSLLKGITRLAVNAKGDKLAVVVSE
jgi:hypothetical protein